MPEFADSSPGSHEWPPAPPEVEPPPVDFVAAEGAAATEETDPEYFITSDTEGTDPLQDTPAQHGVQVVEGWSGPSVHSDFEPYRGAVEEIDARLAEGIQPNDLPGYVTSGGVCHVFWLPDDTILKLPRVVLIDDGGNPDPPAPDSALEDYVIPLTRCQGQPGFEQMITYSTEGQGAIICEPAGEMTYAELGIDQINGMPKSFFDNLMETYVKAAELGLWVDADPKNVMVGPWGLTLIDLNTIERAEHDPGDAAEQARVFGKAILFGQHASRMPTFPIAGYRFMEAYTNAFGETEAKALIREWWDRGVPIPIRYRMLLD